MSANLSLGVAPQCIHSFSIRCGVRSDRGNLEGLPFKGRGHIKTDAAGCKKLSHDSDEIARLNQHTPVVDIVTATRGERVVDLRRFAVSDWVAQYGKTPHHKLLISETGALLTVKVTLPHTQSLGFK
jgi:hypothetical protein